jgi:hypothetical protein
MPATLAGARERILAAVSDAPTGELGAPGISSIGGWLDSWEDAPELRFPASVVVYDKMRRDSQVDGILRAITLPIRSTQWRLVGDDVRPEVMAFVRAELGLSDEDTGRRRRRRQGIVFDDYLRHALLMLPFGFMPHEQVYDVGPPSPGQDTTALPRLVAHLAKLAPRMPRSLSGIDVDRDGGLRSIRQHIPRRDGLPGWEEVVIPRDRLVMHVNDREGGDWSGRSILRSSYGDWLIKSRLRKLAAQIVERNGMGFPVVTGPDETKALELARRARGGAEAGMGLPPEYSFALVGVDGTTVDPLPLIKYHDEAMGRAALAMFLNLGHDNGARSLGDTFLDFFVAADNIVADDIGTTTTEYVIRDLVELNFGADEAYPDLVPDPINAEGTPTAEALATLADKGLLGPIDPDLVDDIRRRYNLPRTAGDDVGLPTELDPTGEQVDPNATLDVTDPAALAARALAVADRLATLAAR